MQYSSAKIENAQNSLNGLLVNQSYSVEHSHPVPKMMLHIVPLHSLSSLPLREARLSLHIEYEDIAASNPLPSSSMVPPQVA